MKLNLSGTKIRLVVTVIISLLLIIILCVRSGQKINGSMIQNDAKQNLSTAFNIAKYNEFSVNKGQPTNYREPLTPLIAGIWMKICPSIDLDLPLEDFIEGEPARLVKFSNLFWLFLLLFGAFWCVYIMSNSLALSLFSILLVYCFLPPYINSLLTEISTAALLVWLSWSLVLITKKSDYSSCFMTGIFGGALVMTRAVFLYIVPAMFIVIFILLKAKQSPGFFRKISIAVLCFSIIVFPWMLRNYIKLDYFSVTERGGVVLYTRALKNTMTWTEIKGAIYYWAPWERNRIGKKLDFSSKDLQEDGVLERLNRKLPVSFYQMARSERVRLRKFYEEKEVPNPHSKADKHQQKEAIKKIAGSPLRHIMLTPLFFWRGIPSIKPTSLRNYLSFMNGWPLGLVLVFLYFAVALWSLIRKNYEIMFFCIPACAMISFYSLFSHNIPRYNEPAVPSMLILATIICFIIAKRIKTRICCPLRTSK